MNPATPGELQEAHQPIASLMSKSEKALQKLAPGAWQHAMLQNNLAALHIGSALMREDAGHESGFEREALQKALDAFASMISRAEKAQAGFLPGTSQHTLQLNRLKALRIVEALTIAELDKRDS